MLVVCGVFGGGGFPGFGLVVTDLVILLVV